MTQAVREFFDLPEQIRKNDFVLKLNEGVAHADETVRTYVVTPGILDAFTKALGLVKSALRDGRSHASYVFGSFGSGKSHFMAMLSLLLENSDAAWRTPEFHALRLTHDWVGKTKLLQLRFHMMGQPDLETAVFGEYVRFVRREHPAAPIPALFADDALFADADRLRRQLGDEKFFAPMNPDMPGWGDVEADGYWNETRFREASSSGDSDERARLFSDLVKTHFQAFARQTHSFIDLDTGLAVLTKHAHALGYGGVVFFLDELMLWLASRAGDSAWVHLEVPKLGKLVEAQNADRPIPIISYIARQRDLAELVGEQYEGSENAILRHMLKWWESRIDTISLEDRNLPAIAEKRVLRPKDEAAKKKLDEAFEGFKRAAGASWTLLLGRADGVAFRKLYPFSPALVETLVALSNSLQRERTAIKLLMELLVEHIPDLQLGQIVPVGDLFDVLAGGDDTADAVMKARFESAKALYKQQLLPMLQETNGTTTPERCQRLREHHPTRIGCSGCPERACRNDNRLVKTLLIAALVPEVPSLKDLTASRLVQLNHGTLKSPIPGTESKIAVTKLRDWATKIGQIHLSQQADPAVNVQLEGVDLQPIIELAADHDNAGKRQALLRDLLFESLGFSPDASTEQRHKVEWRETYRYGHVRFGNVRRMTKEQLHCPDNEAWRLVIDYPFDEPGFGPSDDLNVIEAVKEAGVGTWSLVWLPSFFSESSNRLVRDLVILNHILETRDATSRYTQHLTVEQQVRAASDLQNLRNQQKAKLRRILDQAYGLAPADEKDLDTSRSLGSHLFALKPGAQVQETLASNFRDALDNYIAGLLEQRWPRHPAFKGKLSNARLAGRVLEVFGQLVDADEKKLAADKDTVEAVRGTLGQLGFLRTTETSIHYVDDGAVQEIERKRQQRGSESPTVGEVASWYDEAGRMGLEPQAVDVVVRAYARATARTLVRGGRPYTNPPGGALPDDVVLERPELPAPTEWFKALDLAGNAFGIALPGKAIHADNLRRFEDALNKQLGVVGEACAKLPGAVRRWCEAFGASADDSDRLATARSADELCTALRGQPAIAQVGVLAGFEAKTSAVALRQNIGRAKEVTVALDDGLVFGIFQQLVRLRTGAEQLDELRRALRSDEVHIALAERLQTLAKAAQEAVVVVSPAPPPVATTTAAAVPTAGARTFAASTKREALAQLERLLGEVRAASEHDVISLQGTLAVRAGR